MKTKKTFELDLQNPDPSPGIIPAGSLELPLKVAQPVSPPEKKRALWEQVNIGKIGLFILH